MPCALASMVSKKSAAWQTNSHLHASIGTVCSSVATIIAGLLLFSLGLHYDRSPLASSG